MPETTRVFLVHCVRATEVGPVLLATRDRAVAERLAADVSTDEGVLAAQVTALTMDELGTRSPTALFVAGQRQSVAYVSDDRKINGQR